MQKSVNYSSQYRFLSLLRYLLSVLMFPFVWVYSLFTQKVDFKKLDDMDKYEFVSFCEKNRMRSYEPCRESVQYIDTLELESKNFLSNMYELNYKTALKYPVKSKPTVKSFRTGKKMRFAPYRLAVSFKDEEKKYEDDVPVLFADRVTPKHAFDMSPIDKEEILNVLSSDLGSKDMFGVSKTDIKYLPSYMHDKLVAMYQKMLDGDINDRLCVGKSVFTFKDKGDINDIANYRRITSLPNVLNTFHRILNNRISKYLKDNNLFDSTVQKAGLSGQSYGIFEQVYKIKSVIKDANVNKKPCAVMFLDIKSAFDTIDRKAVFYVMEHYGVDKKVINYIKNFYDNLDYYVAGSKQISELRQWRNGLIQGCSLSPLLFTMCMNYILSYINKTSFKKDAYKFNGTDTGVLTLAYMDDVAISCESFDSLNEVFEDIKSIFSNFGLELSTNKCSMMIINEDVEDLKSLKDIPIVAEATYLGDVITCNGSYKKNYDEIKRDTFSRLASLKDMDEEYREERYKKLVPIIKRNILRMYDVEGEDTGMLLYSMKEYLDGLGIDADIDSFDPSNTLNYIMSVSDDSVVKNIPKELNSFEKAKPVKPSKVDLEDIKQSYQSIKTDSTFDVEGDEE